MKPSLDILSSEVTDMDASQIYVAMTSSELTSRDGDTTKIRTHMEKELASKDAEISLLRCQVNGHVADTNNLQQVLKAARNSLAAKQKELAIMQHDATLNSAHEQGAADE